VSGRDFVEQRAPAPPLLPDKMKAAAPFDAAARTQQSSDEA